MIFKRHPFAQSTLVLLLLLNSSGCTSGDSNTKPTFPVSGMLTVDGQPAEGVAIKFNPVDGIDAQQPTITSAMTRADGSWSASTYTEGDGAPEGDYNLTFTWGKLNRMSMSFSGDEFKGRYADPNKSKFQVQVNEDRDPNEQLNLELQSR